MNTRRPTFLEALRFWFKLGWISFGGPTGQIAIMHAELVGKKKWISEPQFLHALNFCMLLPGPEAQQLATYSGWLLHRTAGGLAAGILFVLPSVLILWTVSWIYVRFGQVDWVAAIFYGLKPAVIAIIVMAVVRIGRKVIGNAWTLGLAASAFIAIFFLKVGFPWIIGGAALAGWLISKWRPGWCPAPAEQADSGAPAPLPGFRRSALVAFTWLVIWWSPVVLAGLLLGWDHTVVREGRFFSKAALVTFGGAYAVLPYVAQQAVGVHGWVSPGQMLDGLGLAETTPGPLIMVVQFVGFMGGWHFPGSLHPLVAATLGAFITTWVTFAPCFLWIFVAAPYVETLRGSRRLASMLSSITAAVVGVILNLAVWFGLKVLFPHAAGADWAAIAISVAALLAMWKWRVGVVSVVAGGGVAGLLLQLAA